MSRMSTTRRTKIVATLGPASEAPDRVLAMLRAGADVIRLNFSHGTVADHERRLAAARQACEQCGQTMAVLQDLPGLKLRIGSLPGGRATLAVGTDVALTPSADGAAGAIPVAYPHLLQDLEPGHRIFLQDGEIALTVRAVAADHLTCHVDAGGVLREHVGLNLPGIRLSAPGVTAEDQRALEWGIAHDVDYVGLSFIESASDIERARALVAERKGRCRLVAKIERRRALDRIDEIVAAADAVMVARGDLAVETSIDEVPVVQKSIIALCNRLGKPVITATQMLESMISHPRPTRAEAADVANAVFDGTDALMLSAETAIGQYPVESVATMATIAERAEGALPYHILFNERAREATGQTSEAIALAACQAADAIDAAAIVAATDSGSTALRVSRFRPRRPVVAVTHKARTSRMLALIWGVVPVLVGEIADLDTLVARGVRAAVELGVARSGDQVVVTAGVPIGRPGSTNFLKVVRVE
jgi:pyruvate kinase